MIAPRPVQTARLVLSPIAPNDADEVATIGAQPDVVAMTISTPQPMSVAVASEWIWRQCVAMTAGGAATYSVRLIPDGPILGVVSLHHIERDHGCAELSFWFRREARGRGYASEAASAVVRHGFTALALHRIEAYHMVRNAASGRVLARIGFQFEGLLRERVAKGARREDVKLWAMLASDRPASASLAPARSRRLVSAR